jgi:hypothetical protein
VVFALNFSRLHPKVALRLGLFRRKRNLASSFWITTCVAKQAFSLLILLHTYSGGIHQNDYTHPQQAADRPSQRASR